MEKKEQFIHLYHLYLNNQCNEEELKEFFALLDKGHLDQEMVTLMSGSWDEIHTLPEAGLIPPFLQAEAKEIQLAPSRRSYFGLKQWIGVAAALLIFTGLYFYRSTITGLLNPGSTYQFANTSGKRMHLQLADGTKVWLSPNSKLGYPNKFEDSERRVSLDGEAFFEVAHDARHPFIIKSGEVNTTVLGTSFNVTAYTLQNTINITLVTGKVTVALDSQRDTITANQRIVINKATSSITKENFPDAATFLNKRIGIYDYNGTTLQEVGRDLENQYNIKIQLDADFSEKAFYGNLDMTDSLDETLNKLCTVMEAKWKKDGGRYVIIK